LPVAPGTPAMTPAASSSRSRFPSSVREMSGMARWISLKRWLPANSSRRMIGVQRAANTSHAIASGQNWPKPLFTRLH
jgi:hypothetical protein